MLRQSMNILSGLLSLYLMLIMIRVLLSWFHFTRESRLTDLLKMITDPYLNWFKQIRFLRFGMMDFSPLLGLILLNVLINITSAIAQTGTVTAGLALAYLVIGLWSALDFFCKFMLVLAVVRLISMLFNPVSPIWRTIDMILNPIGQLFFRLFKKAIHPQIILGITALLFLIISFVGTQLFNYLAYLLLRLPF